VSKIATLTLTALWVNLVSTGAAVSAYSDPGRSRVHDIAGDVRTYAGGRQRSASQTGERTVFSFQLLGVTAATCDTLRLWVGQTVQVRDHRGQRFFGVYYSVDMGAGRRDKVGVYDPAITLKGVTYTEAV